MDAIWAALAGMLVYLDTTAIAQIMICQPLIACPLWGFLVGRPEIGLVFGISFQLIWMGNLQIGAAKFPEGNLGAFIATATATSVAPSADGEPAWIVLFLALVIGIITAHLGSEIAPLVRRMMRPLSERFVRSASAGQTASMRTVFLSALGIHMLAGFGAALLFYMLGQFALQLTFGDWYRGGISDAVRGLTDPLASGAWPVLLGAGAAVITMLMVKRSSLIVYVLATVLTSVAGWLWLS